MPQRVRRATKCSAAASARPDHRDQQLQRVHAEPMLADAAAACRASGDGRLRGSLPKVNITALSSTMPSATVAISQASDPRLDERPHRRALDQQAVQRAQQQRQQRWPAA